MGRHSFGDEPPVDHADRPADQPADESADAAPGYRDLGFARLDTDRLRRTGDPEVIFGQGKTTEQVLLLVLELLLQNSGHPAVVTRASREMLAALAADYDDVEIDELARCAAVGPLPEPRGQVAVLSAGTSDRVVAAEAAFIARVSGTEVTQINDVGVAGIHRLLAVQPVLDRMDCLVVVAGMDGALPSAVGGLTGVPLIAVPTSVGYGASFGGVAALLTMLNSCAPGVLVCNIDNGFGAGLAAARIARRSVQPSDFPEPGPPDAVTPRLAPEPTVTVERMIVGDEPPAAPEAPGAPAHRPDPKLDGRNGWGLRQGANGSRPAADSSYDWIGAPAPVQTRHEPVLRAEPGRTFAPDAGEHLPHPRSPMAPRAPGSTVVPPTPPGPAVEPFLPRRSEWTYDPSIYDYFPLPDPDR